MSEARSDLLHQQNREARATRCPACQLQICKSRDVKPHENLVEADRNTMPGADRAYTCQTCGIMLVNSRDARKPGWSQTRAH
jgi:uncharacterized protein with PIN domain